MAHLSSAQDIELSAYQSQRSDNVPQGDSIPTPSARIPATYPSGTKLVLVTIGLVLSIFLSALDSTIIATAIPKITDEFGSIANIAWYGSAYAITNTAFQTSWGKAYNFFSLKYTFLLAIAVFESGNVICAVSLNSSMLIFGRVIAGAGGGGIMTGAFIIIAFTAKPEYRAAYMGVLGVTFGASSVVGPLLGGVLTDGPGWRWCFWVSLPIGFAAALTMFLFFTPPVPPKEAALLERIVHMDLLGGVLISGSLSCFVLAMHWSGIYSWSNPRSILIFTSSILLFCVFCINEWRMGDKAMVQSHLLRKLTVLPNLIYIFFLAGLFFPLLYTLPVRFQSVHNTSASQSGIRLIPLVLGVSVFTMVSNGLLTFWRHYKPFLLVGALLGTAGVSKMYTLDSDASVGDWIGFEMLAAMGIGLALQIPMIANQTMVSSEDIGSVTAISLFFENMGTTIFVAAGEAAFAQGLMASISKNIPRLDPHAVLNIGVTQIRTVFVGSELNDVLESYLEGCRISQVISVACGVVACLVSLGCAGKAGIREMKIRLKKVHSP
ncbi:MFS gliotoxin efflux transporter glia [Lojkania enalia]|uniref:MFS gliotoxin efflux transporter glia n=1 Tax=Lojkania enalia TaxID=147567 RepID=A0A9P4JYQ2_9PLEO|nr:MFS gliotoxin efflux transporter glia [Didymosphaeria enalia]